MIFILNCLLLIINGYLIHNTHNLITMTVYVHTLRHIAHYAYPGRNLEQDPVRILTRSCQDPVGSCLGLLPGYVCYCYKIK